LWITSDAFSKWLGIAVVGSAGFEFLKNGNS